MSKTLPTAWVDRIFLHLSAMYGNKFSAMWADSNPQAVKAIWAEKLGGFTDQPEAIKTALDSFEDSPWPPTLPEFLAACRTAAKRITVPSLPPPAPMPAAEASALLQEANRRMGPRAERDDPKLWAKKLKAKYLAGEKLLFIQMSMASEALGEKWEDGKILPRRGIE
jgi:hypothetical protein